MSSPGTSARRRSSIALFNKVELTPDERSKYDAAVEKWVKGVTSNTDEVENRPNASDFHVANPNIATSARPPSSISLFNKVVVLTPEQQHNYDVAYAKWVEGALNSKTDVTEKRPMPIDFKGGNKRGSKKRGSKKRSCKKRGSNKRSCKKRGSKKRGGKKRV